MNLSICSVKAARQGMGVCFFPWAQGGLTPAKGKTVAGTGQSQAVVPFAGFAVDFPVVCRPSLGGINGSFIIDES
jgi:hypothetical protein